MKYRSLVFVFLALVLMCGSASAISYVSNDQIRVLNEGDNVSLSAIRDSINDSLIISNVGAVWYVNKTLNAGSWDVTFVGTYTEAQTEITGVEVMP